MIKKLFVIVGVPVYGVESIIERCAQSIFEKITVKIESIIK